MPHKVKPPDLLVGDLDLVVWIGNKVLIGETKCFRRPATVHEWFQHEGRIRDAVQQLRRKVDYARTHPEWLAAQIREAGGAVDLACISVSGCVVLNSALGALQVIDEVPIVDFTLLSRYFDPGHADFLGSKNPVRFDRVTFYGSQEEAAQNLEGYLCHPPHVGFYKTSIDWEERSQFDFAHPGRMVARIFPAVRLAGKEDIRLP
ncbi:hypothetical protein [Myxococcus fulvus]|uniref:hypothetical protein n=1 Tax=Myxococcus fulvus TaxID=33 RepID=UPI0020BF99AB|nr:hypothetical protein [Myxococcus fulvus]MCK8503237.1 hypothetical protein [Myxococcus fulvus]